MKKNVFVVAAFSIIAMLGIGMVSAFGPGQGFMGFAMSDEDKEAAWEQREALENAVEEGDYDSWKSLMEERIAAMQDFIDDEANFDEIVSRHEEMIEVRASHEAGDFSDGEGFGRGRGMGKMARGEDFPNCLSDDE